MQYRRVFTDYKRYAGSLVLNYVKLYRMKKEVIADQSKHFAVATYSNHKYGFLIRDAKRFDK
jgi:hypothetical protein